MVADSVESRLLSLADSTQASHLMRFFKTGPGEYGEGDRFLGVRVPQTRAVIRDFKRLAVADDVERLTVSPWHEVRLAGFLLLVEIYRRVPAWEKADVVKLYLSILERGNNWDLVDVVAPKILGEYLVNHPADCGMLDALAERNDSLWHQRVAVVSTWTLIRSGVYEHTFRLVEKLMQHPHDLMHKACGWMLREAGKRGAEKQLRDFLNLHAAEMPRTMLRYAIEKLDPESRRAYMAL